MINLDTLLQDFLSDIEEVRKTLANAVERAMLMAEKENRIVWPEMLLCAGMLQQLKLDLRAAVPDKFYRHLHIALCAAKRISTSKGSLSGEDYDKDVLTSIRHSIKLHG